MAVVEKARQGLELRVTRCPDQGLTQARNHGFSLARGDYVQWLDADDTLSPEKIEHQVKALESDPGASFAYGDWEWRFFSTAANAEAHFGGLKRTVLAAAYGDRRWTYRLGDFAVATLHFELRQHDDFLTRLLEDKWLPPHAYLVRRATLPGLPSIESFDPETQIGEDRQYLLASALEGHRFIYTPQSTVYYNAWSETQMTSRITPQVRAENLKRIYQGLQRRATQLEGFSDDQLFLLKTSWDFWRPRSDGQIRLTDQHPLVRDSPKLRAVAAVLSHHDHTATLEDHAKRIAYAIPDLWEHHTHILRVLVMLCENGLMRRETHD